MDRRWPNTSCTSSCFLLIDRPAGQPANQSLLLSVSSNLFSPIFKLLIAVVARKNLSTNGWVYVYTYCRSLIQQYQPCYRCCQSCLQCHLWTTLTLVFAVKQFIPSKMKGFDDQRSKFILFADNEYPHTHACTFQVYRTVILENTVRLRSNCFDIAHSYGFMESLHYAFKRIYR